MPSVYMDGIALKVLLQIDFVWVFLFHTSEFLKLQNRPWLQQFKDLKCFLPQGTQKGVFTVVAKENINLNSRSSTATMNYHGNGFLLIQMHYAKESEGTVYNYIYTMDNVINILKIDSMPEEYSQISTFLSDLAVYYAPKCKNSMEIQSLDSSLLNEAVQQEIE